MGEKEEKTAPREGKGPLRRHLEHAARYPKGGGDEKEGGMVTSGKQKRMKESAVAEQ